MKFHKNNCLQELHYLLSLILFSKKNYNKVKQKYNKEDFSI